MILDLMSKLVLDTGKIAVKHSTTILAALACGGVITTSVLSATGTVRALDKLADAEDLKEKEFPGVPLTAKERALACWKEYIPAAVMGGFTIACIVSGHSISANRSAVLASAYGVAESAFKEYRDKVRDQLGERKADRIEGELAQDKIDRTDGQTIIVTDRGDVLCYDEPSARYFQSDVETIRRIENDINYRLRTEMRIPLNDFYADLRLERTKLGENNGWDIDKGPFEIKYRPRLTKQNKPCVVLCYETTPLV